MVPPLFMFKMVLLLLIFRKIRITVVLKDFYMYNGQLKNLYIQGYETDYQ